MDWGGDYLALMGLGVFLAHYGAKLLKGTERRRKEEKSLKENIADIWQHSCAVSALSVP